MDVLRQFACMVVNPIADDNFAFFITCYFC